MATKKSFRENPALQFISVVTGGEAQSNGMERTGVAQPAAALATPESAQEPETVRTVFTPPSVPARGADAPVHPMRLDPRYIETKSRRMHLLLRPSLYDALKVRAVAAGVSVNEWVHEVLEGAVRG